MEKTGKEIVSELIKELKQASEAYYQKMEESPLTDEEFDDKLTYLESYSTDPEYKEYFTEGTDGYLLLEGSPSLGTSTTAVEKVKHSTPMLSLNKAKTEKELSSYLTKAKNNGAEDFILQAKLDGFAISAVYTNGELTTLATRGDGETGENITYLTKDSKVSIKGLPEKITLNGVIEVRGELYMDHAQFKKVNTERLNLTGEEFKNSRNAVVGLMKKSKLGVDYPVEFTYSTYNCFKDHSPADLSMIESQGFKTVTEVTKEQAKECKLTGFRTLPEIIKAVENFGELRKNFTIPTDGVVIKPTNEAEMLLKMGYTSHHPSSQIAYKYPGEKIQTTILDMIISVGRTGKLTPTARVEKVWVDGSDLEFASCHNYNWIAHRDARIGSIVTIEKANDIIPQIATVIHNPDDSIAIKTPKDCPACSTELVFEKDSYWPPKTLLCPNIKCPEREYMAVLTAVRRDFLHIDRLAESTLKELNRTGRVKDIGDLYTLTVEELTNSTNGYTKDGTPKKLGEKTAKHIVSYIEASKDLPLWRLLASLNIDMLSFTTAKKLTKRYKNLETIQGLTIQELSSLDGFGEKTAEKIIEGLRIRSELISRLQSYGVKFIPEQETQPSSNTSHLSGLSFAISGEVPEPFKNRNEWVNYIEENGGEFHSGPKATTSFIIGDPESSSTKTKKALTLGVKFLTPEEFTKNYVKN